MGKPSAVISCLLLIAGAVTAQTGINERLLPQWLTGIIAVAAFLFLTFVSFLVKKAWCEESSRSVRLISFSDFREKPLCVCLLIRSKEDMNAYENLVIDSTTDKVTAM
uniref:PDZK1-interacting protein 1-like n=1 Tax=Seriola dumerili TaxID=41447 RepID=A0A3B4VEI2_SERDU